MLVKVTVSSKNAFRCQDCRAVIKDGKFCDKCGSLNLKPIKIHTVKPKKLVAGAGRLKA